MSLDPVATTPVPALPTTVESDDGRTVEVTDVSRIVPLYGNISEVVFALAWCLGYRWAPRLADLPDLSGHQVYACGAPIVVDSARWDYLALGGLPEEEFFADSFTTEADKAKA